MTRNKSTIKSSLMVTGMLVCAFIIVAQVNLKNSRGIDSIGSKSAIPQMDNDTIPAVNNEVGLAELEKVLKRYESGSRYLLGEISFYDNLDSIHRPQEKTVFISTITDDGNFLYEIDSVLTVKQADITLLIDKREKSIAIMEESQEEKTDNSIQAQNIANSISEVKKYISSITKKELGGGVRLLTIEFGEDAPSNNIGYEIEYSSESYKIFKIRIKVTDGEISQTEDGKANRDELVLVDEMNNETSTGYFVSNVRISMYEIVYKTERLVEKNSIDINRYVQKDEEGFRPVGLYKNYQLLN